MTAPAWTVLTGRWQDLVGEIPQVDHVITDPPYSPQVHAGVRSAKRASARDVSEFRCRTRRTVDLGFGHITQEEREALADFIEERTKRWALVFSDVESAGEWRGAFTEWSYRTTLVWDRVGGAPRFVGDQPAPAVETITALHHPSNRRRWNGGGKRGIYSHPIAANRAGARGERVHPTQKPLSLMMDLVRDFTDEGDLILDPYCGSGTTGEACLRLGRRFLGIEANPDWAELSRARLAGAECGLSLGAVQRGQVPLFQAL